MFAVCMYSCVHVWVYFTNYLCLLGKQVQHLVNRWGSDFLPEERIIVRKGGNKVFKEQLASILSQMGYVFEYLLRFNSSSRSSCFDYHL